MRALIPLIHQMFINISHPIIELLATSELKEIKIFFLNPLLLIFLIFLLQPCDEKLRHAINIKEELQKGIHRSATNF